MKNLAARLFGHHNRQDDELRELLAQGYAFDNSRIGLEASGHCRDHARLTAECNLRGCLRGCINIGHRAGDVIGHGAIGNPHGKAGGPHNEENEE